MNGSSEEDQVAETEIWLKDTLDSRFQFRDEFLRNSGWSVVPVESAQHFNDDDAKSLAGAAMLAGKAELTAILLEDLERVRKQRHVSASQEGLLEFNRECAHFSYALLPDDRSFAIICTTGDYFLVAGQKSFVETAVGKTIAEALADFERFSSGNSWSASNRARLTSVLQKYSRA